MSDIVEELREEAYCASLGSHQERSVLTDAADAIVSLTEQNAALDAAMAEAAAEIRRLREALADLVAAIDAPRYGDDSIWDDLDGLGARPGPLQRARTVLGVDEPD